MSECTHEFMYAGIVFEYVGKAPGSGAEIRVYYDRYYCMKCLYSEYRKISGNDNSYCPLKYNATPKEIT